MLYPPNTSVEKIDKFFQNILVPALHGKYPQEDNSDDDDNDQEETDNIFPVPLPIFIVKHLQRLAENPLLVDLFLQNSIINGKLNTLRAVGNEEAKEETIEHLIRRKAEKFRASIVTTDPLVSCRNLNDGSRPFLSKEELKFVDCLLPEFSPMAAFCALIQRGVDDISDMVASLLASDYEFMLPYCLLLLYRPTFEGRNPGSFAWQQALLLQVVTPIVMGRITPGCGEDSYARTTNERQIELCQKTTVDGRNRLAYRFQNFFKASDVLGTWTLYFGGQGRVKCRNNNFGYAFATIEARKHSIEPESLCLGQGTENLSVTFLGNIYRMPRLPVPSPPLLSETSTPEKEKEKRKKRQTINSDSLEEKHRSGAKKTKS